jgi:hypothetical protein
VPISSTLRRQVKSGQVKEEPGQGRGQADVARAAAGAGAGATTVKHNPSPDPATSSVRASVTAAPSNARGVGRSNGTRGARPAVVEVVADEASISDSDSENGSSKALVKSGTSQEDRDFYLQLIEKDT